MKPLPPVTEIDIDDIKDFIQRGRSKAEFEEMKESIRLLGIKQPVAVREISHLPASERKREGGGLFKYQRIWGQGRIQAARELGWKRVPALIFKHEDVKESDIISMFVTENMARKPLPWAEKAQLVADEVKNGAAVEDVAKRFGITVSHTQKFLRIMNGTAKGLRDEVAAMPMNDAEVLTTMPPADQAIVVEVLRENPERQVRDVIRKAKEIVESGAQLSPAGIRASMKRVDEDLAELRKSMKVTRLHHALGCQNLAMLLEQKGFRAALKREGVNVEKFEKLSNS